VEDRYAGDLGDEALALPTSVTASQPRFSGPVATFASSEASAATDHCRQRS
jgi:hypothetical protein